MKPHARFLLLAATLLSTALPCPGATSKTDNPRRANTVVLTENGVKNLRLQTAEVEEGVFEETVFALGHTEAVPGKVSVVSSRIAGRVSELKVFPGDTVKAGQDVLRVESRQPGDPPPSVALKAPMDGVVSKLEVRLGEPVDPDKALLEVVNLEDVFAIAHIPEAEAGRIPAATLARVRVAALPGETFESTLVRLATAADRRSGTLDAVFRLPNPKGLLRADMRAEFSIVVNHREGVTSIPRSALQGDPANRFVYVEDFELKNAFVKSEVVVGQVSQDSVEILSGLLPGDKVVTHGAYLLAFAGPNSISLKEALDAAHGHPHNEDGSEITPDQKKSAAAHSHGADAHPHGEHGSALPWKITCAGLVFLLLFALSKWRAALGLVPKTESGGPR